MCIGRSCVEVASDQRINMNEKAAWRRRHVIPRLNICHNLSRWVRRRRYQRLSKVPARSHSNNIRIRIHPAAARRRAQIINPRLQMVPGIHIRIISPISLLLKLRDIYARKVSLMVTTTSATSSSPKPTTMKKPQQQRQLEQQHAAAEVADEVRVKLQSVRELLAEEGL